MPNVPIRAAGEAVPAVSRRAFLRTTASAGIATAAAGGAFAVEAGSSHAAGPSAADAALAGRLDAALADFLVEAREIKRLEDAYGVALDSLPDERRPDPRDYWQKRRSDLFEQKPIVKHPDGSITVPAYKPLTGEARRNVRLQMIAGMREVVAERRRWDAERRAAGLDALDAAITACSGRMDARSDRLKEMAVGFSPPAVAVLALFEYRFSRDEDFPLTMLKRTAPHLTGLLAVVVDDMIRRGATHVNTTILEGGAGGEA